MRIGQGEATSLRGEVNVRVGRWEDRSERTGQLGVLRCRQSQSREMDYWADYIGQCTSSCVCTCWYSPLTLQYEGFKSFTPPSHICPAAPSNQENATILIPSEVVSPTNNENSAAVFVLAFLTLHPITTLQIFIETFEYLGRLPMCLIS